MEVGVFASIRRGWIFLKQSWVFGQRSSALLVPTLLSFLVSMICLVVMLLPLSGLIVYIRKTVWGQFAIGVLIGMLLILMMGIFNWFRFMTAFLAGEKMRGISSTTSQAWERISGFGGSLFWIGMGIPLQAAWVGLTAFFTGHRRPTGWERDMHLLMPIMANETTGLAGVPGRIKHFQSENCLFSADSVGIKALGILLMAGASVLGLAAGIGGMNLVLDATADPGLARGLAFAVAVVLIAIFLLPVVSVTGYAQTLFDTCLYQWGLNVLNARQEGSNSMAVVPEPLAVALGLKTGR